LLNASGQPTGDSLTIDGYWWNTSGTNLAVFANGTTLPLNHQLTETWIGSATQTTLVGSDFTPNVFDLGTGGDQVTLGANYDGGNGQNIVNFGTGDGAATISGYGGTATIDLAAGINLTDVSFSTDPNGDIILALSDGTDRIVAAGGLYNTALQQLDFANGTTLLRSQILYTAETGMTGNDTITVPSGSEVIDGRGGNDVINGGGGYDSYIYRQGYGNLTINNAAGGSTVANGELDFGPGITEQDLWFSQSGKNLDINVLGSQSQIVVDNWFGGNSGAHLTEIKAYDGMEIDAGLNQLVAAMAVFQANNPAFNAETALQMPNDPSLQAAIAASWHAAA
jgi:Ca2+-binding RTX toxin-like protein